MNPEALNLAQKKIEAAERCIKLGQLKQARKMLDEISVLHVDLQEKEVIERAQNLLARIERMKSLSVSRRVMVFMAILVSVAVAVLISFRVSSTIVELQVASDRVTFTTEKPFEIGPIPISRFDLFGSPALQLGRVSVQKAGLVGSKAQRAIPWWNHDLRGSVQLQGDHPQWSVKLSGDYLRIANLRISKDAKVILESDSIHPGNLKMIISGADVIGSLDSGSLVDAMCNSCSLIAGRTAVNVDNLQLRLAIEEKQIGFAAGVDQMLIIGIGMKKDEHGVSYLNLNTRVQVSTLGFNRLAGESVESSIIDRGLIRLIELDGKEIPIETSQIVQTEKLHNFEIKGISMGNHLNIHGYGEVGLLKTGYPQYLKNKLPSYLEWLRVNYLVNLYLGMLGSVLSVILAILYRLKAFEEE